MNDCYICFCLGTADGKDLRKIVDTAAHISTDLLLWTVRRLCPEHKASPPGVDLAWLIKTRLEGLEA